MFLLFLASARALQPADAAPPAPPVAVVQPAAPAVPILAAGTSIDLEFTQAASSRTSKSGDQVWLQVADDVRGPGGQILIPKGSRAMAEVIQASPGRMMGKAGELTLAARHVEVGGQKVTLKRFRFGRSAGKDNAGTTMIATALIGLPGMLISGGNIDVAVGARANAVVVSDTPLTASTSAETNQQTGG